MAKLLMIEDDKNLCVGIQDWFEHKHHSVECVHDGNDGLAYLLTSSFDLVIMDVNLPGLNGFEISKRFRASGAKTPLLMLTGQDQLPDKEMGFGSGADDYLTKPFFLEELFLRVQSLLRRAGGWAADSVLRAGDLLLDSTTFSVMRGSERLNISRMEFLLLEFLMRHPKKVFSPETLVSRIWPSESETSPETVRTYIKRLRSKIDIEGRSSVIRNIHGVGYSFESC